MWIEDYRIENGMELDEFTAYVNAVRRTMKPRAYAHISDSLIHMLECDPKSITHPHIANAIATACGATREQRDSIVAEHHRGTWTPTKMVAKPVTNAHEGGRNGSRAVVKIDRYGNTIEWYYGVAEAARNERCSEYYIRNRCRRKIDYDFADEEDKCTFRYDDEWSKLSSQEKLNDLRIKCEIVS